MALENIIRVTIRRGTVSITRTGFGTPCILDFFSQDHFSDRAKVYTSLDGVEADGFGTEHFVHRAANAIFSQNPRIRQVVVGRRALGVTRLVDLTPAPSPQPFIDYKVTVNDQTATYKTDATPTVAEVTAGVAAAITALMPATWLTATSYAIGDRRKNNGNIYVCVKDGTSGVTGPSGTRDDIVDNTVTWAYVGPTVTATDVGPGTNVRVTQDTAGAPFLLEVEKRALLAQDEATTDPGIATDLSAVRTELDGNDDWYVLISEASSAAEIAALAAAIEPLRKLYVSCSADDDVPTSATDDIGSTLEAANYGRSAIMWHTKTAGFPEGAWSGVMLTYDPGAATWRNKALAGITATKVSESERLELVGKRVNHYIPVGGGLDLTAEGVVSGPEFIDTVRFIDALVSRIEENQAALLASVPKIPYTPGGAALIENTLRADLAWGVEVGGLAADPPPFVNMPNVLTVDPQDRADRVLRNIEFGARLAGAVHEMDIVGTLTD